MLILTLSISSYQKDSLREGATFRLSQSSGSFGRSVDNDWSLPDPERFISSRHGLIEFREGDYYLIDQSLNGIYMNQSAVPLGKNNEVVLSHGDTLTFGDYVVQVELSNSAQSHAEPADPFLDQAPAMESVKAPWESSVDVDGELSDPFLVPDTDQEQGLDFLQPSPPEEPNFSSESAAHPAIESQGQGSILDSVFTPPEVAREAVAPVLEEPVPTPGSGFIPEDWDQTGFGVAPVTPAVTAPIDEPPRPRSPATPIAEEPIAKPITTLSNSKDDLLAAFCRGLGVDAQLLGDHDEAELMATLGTSFRELLDGVLDLLRARTELKNQFRMSQTMIQAVDNNPLKFSLSLEAALRHLYAEPDGGNLKADQAVKQAVSELRSHQLGMMIAMEQTFNSFVAKLDPINFQPKKNDESGSVSGLLGGFGGKSKAWENYHKFYTDRLSDSKLAFRSIFEEEFAENYQQVTGQLD